MLPPPNRISTTGPRHDRGQDRDRDHDVDEQAERPRQELGEGILAPDRGLARQRWQDDDAERHADDPERDLEQREGEVEVRDRAVAEQAGERRHHDEGDLGHPEADRARRHEDERLRAPGRVASIRGS